MKTIVVLLTTAFLIISPNVCAAKSLSSAAAACHLTQPAAAAGGHTCCEQTSVPSSDSAMTCCPLSAEILKKEKISFEQFQILHSELLPLKILTEISAEKSAYAPETPPLFTSRIFTKTYSSNSPPSVLNFSVSKI